METSACDVNRTLLHVTGLAATFAMQQLHYVRRDLTYRTTHFVVLCNVLRYSELRVCYDVKCTRANSPRIRREFAALFGTPIHFGITKV